jgi:hypothetical protein
MFLQLSMQAQVRWSEIYEGSESDAQFLISNNQQRIFLLNKKSGFLFSKDKWMLNVFDEKTLQRKHETQLVFSDETEQFDKVLTLKNKNYILTESYHKSVKTLYAYQLDTAGAAAKLEGTLAQISKLDFRNDVLFHALQSYDTSMFCVYHVLPEKTKKTLHVVRFNDYLKQINTYDFELPYGEMEFHFLDAISTQNEMALLIKVGDDDKLRLFSNRTYSYFIFKINWNTGESTNTKVSLKNKSVIIGSAFYTDKNQNIGLCGFQKFVTDKNDNVTSPFITQFHNTGASRNVEDYTDDYAQPSFQMNLIKDDNPYEYIPLIARTDADGTVTLVNEKFYLETSCITDMRSGLQRCNYYYHFDNIEAYTFLPTLEAKKRFVFEKRQISINDDGYYSGTLSSYFHHKYYFVYADSKKNELLYTKPSMAKADEGLHYMNSPRKSNVVLASYDSSGLLHRKVLFNNADTKTIFSAQKSLFTSEGKIIFYSKRNNKFRLGLLEITE